jgi:hypothetical protein
LQDLIIMMVAMMKRLMMMMVTIVKFFDPLFGVFKFDSRTCKPL